MSQEKPKQDAPEDVAERIEGAEWYSYLAKVGFVIILVAFLSALVGVLPSNLNSVSAAVNAILLPLIFVGIGFLLLRIAIHLHLLHLNLVRQIQKRMEESDGEDDTKE
ncbi:hypothetical protein HYG81_25795 (plasmid) [Natrinema zhouii]|uniref:hypothetical protein n=1 Tax=Natrinema zhouii TaxID=1710539 RepID=UPI001CFF644C|nr:hypothetical protein [Natrinema zhouii]UHQ99253.1 hypothetical protein HYG81_25795 [Natrinema zhouii]